MRVVFTNNSITALVLRPDDGADELLIAALLRVFNEGGRLLLNDCKGKGIANYVTDGYPITDYDTAKIVCDYTEVLDPVEDDDGG